MPYDIVDTWDPDRPVPRGWYRLASGRLVYWDGTAWSGAPQAAPAAESRIPVEPAPARWATASMVLGWIALIMVLGSAISGVQVVGVDCGTVFSPSSGVPEHARAACAAALAARAHATALISGVAALCLLAAVAMSRPVRRIAQRHIGRRTHCVC